MSNPNLSPELKAQIDKYIADELARREALTNPPAPRELTPAEQASAHLDLLDRLERSDKSSVSGSGPTHERIAMILRLLVGKVFPPEQETPDETPESTSTDVPDDSVDETDETPDGVPATPVKSKPSNASVAVGG